MNNLEKNIIKEQYIGMRSKIDKEGSTILYANGWTLIKDCYKWLIKQLKK